jgi:hypothetical protein
MLALHRYIRVTSPVQDEKSRLIVSNPNQPIPRVPKVATYPDIGRSLHPGVLLEKVLFDG